MFWNIAAAPLTRLGGVAKSAFEGRFMTEPSRGGLGQTENTSILNQLQIDTHHRWSLSSFARIAFLVSPNRSWMTP